LVNIRVLNIVFYALIEILKPKSVKIKRII